MLDIGGWEFLIIAFVLLMVVGPKELPKLLRGFTRGMRQVRSMASEFTRGMEDLAADSELGDLKKTVVDAKRGDLASIADKIDPKGDLKDSLSDIKETAEVDTTHDELSGVINVGEETKQEMASATRPDKPTEVKSEKKS